MKVLFFTLLISFYFSSTNCQLNLQSSIFKDAKDFINNPDSRRTILDFYKIDGTNKFFTVNDLKSLNDPEIIAHGGQAFSNYQFNVTKPVDILSTFIVSRVKKELAINFFTHFSKTIRNEKVRDLSIMFSNTYDQLDLIGEKIYNYEDYLDNLRESLNDDYKLLPSSLKKLINDPNSQIGGIVNSDQNFKYISETSLSILELVKTIKHPGKVISELNFSSSSTSVDQNLIGSLLTLQLFSESLKSSNSSGNYWVNKAEINEVLLNPEMLQVFLGLLAAQAKNYNIRFKDKSLYDLLNDRSIETTKIQNLITQVITIAQNIDEIIKESTRPGSTPDENRRTILQYYHKLTQLIEVVSSIDEIFIPSNKTSNKFTCFFSSISNVTLGFESNNPSTSFLGLVQFLKCLNSKNDDFKELVKFLDSRAEFIADIQKAKTNDEVVAIIERIAAPVGSWRDKRNSKWNIAFDSYVGGSYLRSMDTSYFAISTPVGLSISKSLGNLGSITILASIIDIGPLTAFRFRNSTDQIEKVYLKEIYSPGILGSWGMGKNFIFNITGGWQKFTALKSVLNDQNVIQSQNRSGWSIGATVNIPLRTLFNNK